MKTALKLLQHQQFIQVIKAHRQIRLTPILSFTEKNPQNFKLLLQRTNGLP